MLSLLQLVAFDLSFEFHVIFFYTVKEVLRANMSEENFVTQDVSSSLVCVK